MLPVLRRSSLALLLVAAACGKPAGNADSGTETPPAPKILSTTPAADSTGVLTDATIAITFDTELDPSSLEGSFSVDAVTTTLAYDGSSRTVTLTPTAPLEKSREYTAHVLANVKSSRGVALGAETSWSFTTEGPPPPHVLSVTPAEGAVDVDPTTAITATFDTDLDETTVTANFTVANVSGTVSFDHATHVATFTPDATLPFETQLTATIGAEVTASNGIALGHDRSWSFTTLGDHTAPTVTSTVPEDGGTASGASAIVFNFSEPLAVSTLTPQSLVVETTTGAAVAGNVSWEASQNAARFVPQAAWSSSTTYRARATTALTDLAGNALASAYELTFQGATDTTPPKVVSINPANNATGVSVNTDIVVTFSEALEPFSVNTTSFTMFSTAITVTWDAANLRAVVHPTYPLQPGQTYALKVEGVRDLAGNVLPPYFYSSFTTQPDTTPPTLLSTYPGANDTGVSSHSVTLNFNESMAGVSATASRSASGIIDGGAVGLGGFYTSSTPGSYTAQLDDYFLVPGATYTITVNGSTTKDAHGNALGADYVFSYTAVADTTPPSITSVTPSSGERLVQTDAGVTVQFDELLDPATVNASTVTLSGTTGTVAWDGSSRVTFTPSSPLSPGTEYTFTVSTGVKDRFGNALAAPWVSKFRTVSGQQTLSPLGSAALSEHEVAWNSAGDGFAIWSANDGGKKRVFWSKFTAATSSWSASTFIPDAQDKQQVVAVGTKFVVVYRSVYPSLVKLMAYDGTAFSAPVSFSNSVFGNFVWLWSNGSTAVCVTPSSSGSYAITYNGTTFSSQTSITAALGNSPTVEAVTTPTSILITSMGAYEVYSTLYANGTWTTVTHDSTSGYPVYVYDMHTVSNGTGYAVTWARYTVNGAKVLYARVFDGTTWGAVTTLPSDFPSSSAIGSDGTGYAVAFRNTLNNVSTVKVATYAAGSWSAPVAVSPALTLASDELIGIAGNSSRYVAAWFDNGRPVSAKATSPGTFGGALPVTLSNSAAVTSVRSASLLSGSTQVSLGVVSTTASGDQLDLVLFDSTGTTTYTLITGSKPITPTYSLRGSAFEAVWTDLKTIFERSLVSGSAPSAVRTVSLGAYPGSVGEEAIAVDSNGDALIAFPLFESGDWNLYGVKWTKAPGTLGAPFLIASAQFLVNVATNGQKFVVLYARQLEYGGFGGYTTVYARSVQGSTVSAESVAYTGGAANTRGSFAGGGAGFVYAFLEGLQIAGKYPVQVVTSADGITWSSPSVLVPNVLGANALTSTAVSATTFAVGYGAQLFSQTGSGSWTQQGSFSGQIVQLASDGSTLAAAAPDPTSGGTFAYCSANGTWTNTPIPTSARIYNAYLGALSTGFLSYLWTFPSPYLVIGNTGSTWAVTKQTQDALSQGVTACSVDRCFEASSSTASGPAVPQIGQFTATGTVATRLIDTPNNVIPVYGGPRTVNVAGGQGLFHTLWLGSDPAYSGVTRLYGVMGL